MPEPQDPPAWAVEEAWRILADFGTGPRSGILAVNAHIARALAANRQKGREDGFTNAADFCLRVALETGHPPKGPEKYTNGWMDCARWLSQQIRQEADAIAARRDENPEDNRTGSSCSLEQARKDIDEFIDEGFGDA